MAVEMEGYGTEGDGGLRDGCGILDESTIFELEDTLSALGEGIAMGYEEESEIVVGEEGIEEIEDALGAFGIEIAGGFIAEEDFGIIGECAGDGDTLTFTDGEFLWEVVQSVAHPDEFEEAFGFEDSLADGEWAVEHGDLNIFDNVEGGHEVKGLEDETEIVPSVVVEAGEVLEVDTFEEDGSGGGLIETAEQIEQGGFAATAGTGDSDVFAREDGEGDVDERMNIAIDIILGERGRAEEFFARGRAISHVGERP